MKNYIFIYIAIIGLLSFNGYSQEKRVASADKKYDNYAYVNAIKTYERVANKGYKSEDIFKKLGNAFYFNSQFDKAAKWYGELFAMNTNLEPEYYYRYAQSLKSTGEIEKSKEMLDLFDEKSENDIRAQLYKRDRNYMEEIQANSGRYKIDDAGINSKYSDYGASFYQDKIIFSSARDTGSLGHRRHKWTGESFTNLYQSSMDEDFNPVRAKKFRTKLNTKFHESTPIFTKDGKTVYFTRNNYVNGKKGKNESKITLIKIYKATLQNRRWGNITELPFNSNSYSVAHPALSPDEKTLYFASDMPGTIGQSDIFKVSIDSLGNFGTPVNLGSGINTEGKETFPFVSDEDEIYFASDGHPGLGGLDVFVGKLDENGVHNIQNVGADVNSPMDDFAYIIDTKSRRGFFTSNNGDTRNDNIYKFLETRKLECMQELYGVVTDLDTGEILPDTKLTLFDRKFNLINTVNSDENGNYTFAVECGNTYNIRAEKEEYITKEQLINIPYENGKTNLPIELEKAECVVTIGDDLGKCFGIKMIYFDLDKSNIRPEAALDLEKILDVLNEYPNMKLDIRSHTDSRQTHKYNEALSDRRAKSTIKWLVDNGVDASRLTGRGYGETQLVNECADGVDCTEEQHQMNRRSEFIISDL